MENQDYFTVKCLADGDEEAFVSLYNKYHQKIYHTALKLTQSGALAQDITQNVFLKVWDNRSRLDPEQNFAAFISVICRNAIFDIFKRASSEEMVRTELGQMIDIADDDPYDEQFINMYKQLLDEAISKLPPQRKIIFERCKLQEESYDNVARSLGISRSTVQDHIVKANKTIREYMMKHGGLAFVILFFINN